MIRVMTHLLFSLSVVDELSQENCSFPPLREKKDNPEKMSNLLTVRHLSAGSGIQTQLWRVEP